MLRSFEESPAFFLILSLKVSSLSSPYCINITIYSLSIFFPVALQLSHITSLDFHQITSQKIHPPFNPNYPSPFQPSNLHHDHPLLLWFPRVLSSPETHPPTKVHQLQSLGRIPSLLLYHNPQWPRRCLKPHHTHHTIRHPICPTIKLRSSRIQTLLHSRYQLPRRLYRDLRTTSDPSQLPEVEFVSNNKSSIHFIISDFRVDNREISCMV